MFELQSPSRLALTCDVLEEGATGERQGYFKQAFFFFFFLYIEEAEKIVCAGQGASKLQCFVHQPNTVHFIKQEQCSVGLIIVPTSIFQYF